MKELTGMRRVKFLEWIMLDVDNIGEESVAGEFGSYSVGGSPVPVTSAILFSSDFEIRRLSLYRELPGGYFGNRSPSNFIADQKGVRRLNSVVDDYRDRFS